MTAIKRLRTLLIQQSRCYGAGDVAKGPGPFSKKEHAQEEQYFREKVPSCVYVVLNPINDRR